MTGTVRIDGGDVSTLVLDRPERMNPLTPEAIDDLDDALRSVEQDARVVVLTGAGDDAFIAGGDLTYMQDLSPTDATAFAEQGHGLCESIEQFPAPVIASINGYAFGAGLELALACDLRVASERAVLGEPEIELGVIPGFGGTQRLPRHVGDELARRLLYFGDRIDAQDAYECGLVGDVVAHDELEDYVSELATELAEKPRGALRATKEALNARFEMTQSAGLARERELFAERFGTHDQREGMAAFLEDRDPAFE